MGKYQAYPEYQHSNVRWLPDLPQHWGVERIKRMLKLKRTLVGKKSSEYQLLSLTLKGIITRDISTGEGKIPESFDTYQEVEKNDLVFCLFDMDETPRTVGLSALDGMITGAYNVYGCLDKCYPAYANYYFLHIDKFKGLRPFYTGLRKVVRSESFDNIEMPCPPYEEQTQIANFLDHETAKIDTLIEKQQQLIKLLKEKRQAVISHAVSAKDGERTAKLSYFIDLLSGYAFPSSGFKQEPSDAISLLRGVNVGVDHIKWNETVYWPASDAPKLKEFVLEEGDIVFGMDRPWISSGARVAEIKNSDLPCFLLQRVARIRSLEGTYQPFVKLCLASNEFKRFVEADLTGVSVPHISPEQIKSFPIRAIGYEKQKYVTDLALANCKKLDEIEKKAEKAINLMQERRTALISAAVTGKIDVRYWVKPKETKEVN
ncbi:restriction endonuclease subunit S [Shewanella spartinae]|uniref:restriction endonuclease subunit S n=1 Tax=Shewanella spartinae TaxID=2864205 RepID=UPI001C65B38D|nr:restriction endonuclease subunit S [Shewanella spartinae]QYJ94765.1 restriction endonuclease subunit S [Shewanella spartinae]